MSGYLRLENVSKDFGGVEVLRSIDLEVAAGERHAIIGPNGAGKTTLINIITGKYVPSQGRVWFNDVDVTSLPPHKRVRLGIGRSFQIINVFPSMTVFENMRNAVLSREGIRFSMVHALDRFYRVNAETEGLLELIGLGGFRQLPAGELSYGKQRTLEIGLVLGLDPQLVILDEPTAGISSAETREMTLVMRRATEGRTLILIEHDMDVVFSLAERVSVLHDGGVLAQGTPWEIRDDARVRDAYLGRREGQ